jgi:hypothetical protein
MEEEIKNDAVCLQFYSTSTANALPRKLLKGLEASKQEDNCCGFRRNRTAGLDVGRCYGMEINVEKTKVISTSSQSPPVHVMRDEKKLEHGIFKIIWVA